jgi:hypothetical protein
VAGQLARNPLDARRQRLQKPAARYHVVLRRWCLYSYRLHGTLILKHSLAAGIRALPLNVARKSRLILFFITQLVTNAGYLPVFLTIDNRWLDNPASEMGNSRPDDVRSSENNLEETEKK